MFLKGQSRHSPGCITTRLLHLKLPLPRGTQMCHADGTGITLKSLGLREYDRDCDRCRVSSLTCTPTMYTSSTQMICLDVCVSLGRSGR